MSRKLVITIALVVSMLLMGIVVAGAVTNQSGNEGNIIYAAYNPNTGSLRIVTDGNYRSNEVPIEWNIEGPQGSQGEQGVQGPQGTVVFDDEFEDLIDQKVEDRVAGLEQTIADMQAQIDSILEANRFTSETISLGPEEFYSDWENAMNLEIHLQGKLAGDENIVSFEGANPLNIKSISPGKATYVIHNTTLNIMV